MRPRKVAQGTFPPASPQEALDRLEARQRAAAAALGRAGCCIHAIMWRAGTRENDMGAGAAAVSTAT